MTRLEPKFWRVALRVGAAVVGISVAGYFLEGLLQHDWWSHGYIESMAVPVVIMPIAVWFMFVPSWFEYSEEEISLRTLIRQGTYAWDMLDAYGPGPNVFMIQFKGESGAYQIFSGAYSREDWKAFKKFLEVRFPDRKKILSIGGRLFR